ncbi:glycoprotein [Cryptococcus neoformans C23]|uniref:Glycoprotein n=2 Tax=Cryptococcus neoformans TaxID=5207 RepID=A0A854Q5N1_CRYNE|nr:glycoprotein [Cryptococcus neoformans var. grubii H99]AUB28354.1 glycoprotein [Cryptococcus neoformans var. grubii]OWZ27374.1 glycoprotein [Cryptococcus neoformans var. grubii AD2-60a]OWZ29946.1 glycoprotein [Cryptococcus neoformans var. grubii AD1-83a]OWZ39435.1 glycoprotein [Cryptococcus neoformans var. grubii C23]OWZ54556.1 glycoprotein [Cryptococcus neoformans var. grubii 125.91]OXC81634.1 glycoprotein [Cryptococcus neoformans var. grubii AD1-7a]OXG11844.1 glycoprotein [Cryptococcus n|eukprot:XP_012052961.1 glycoprotein [Cryptococcus neoformans var. grubii H99]
MAGRWPLHPPREQHETPPPQQLPWGFRSWVGTRLAGFRICPCQGDFYLAVAPVYNTHVSLFPTPFPFPQPFLSTATQPSHRHSILPPQPTMLPLSLLPGLLALAPLARAQVTATFPNGATNPETPEFAPIGSYVNQSSDSRLISLNGVDDFCLWGPLNMSGGAANLIGNIEPEVVAYCTKPRNNARLIPDGVITAAHFIKTSLYVQIWGFWDATKIGIPDGDSGGELDPHGAENLGNPIGGNATSNVEGKDVFYEEWMSFISYDQFCLRICTAETSNVTAALQCEHELDIMGCAFVMAIDDFYNTNNSFTSCEGEPAAPPGLYPQANGSTSTFRQRFTGTWSNAETTDMFTVGQTVTPSSVAFYPATSNCYNYSTISNGIDTANWKVTATPSTLSGGSTIAVSSVGTTSQSPPPGISTSSPTSSSSGSTGSSSAGSSSSTGGSASTGAAAVDASGSSSAATKATTVQGQGVVVMGVAVVGMLFGAAVLL